MDYGPVAALIQESCSLLWRREETRVGGELVAVAGDPVVDRVAEGAGDERA